MKIEHTLLERLQEYSSIRLTGQEREDFQTEAGLILVEMNKLFRQETGGVQGMGCSRVCTNVFREDVVESPPPTTPYWKKLLTGKAGISGYPKRWNRGIP